MQIDIVAFVCLLKVTTPTAFTFSRKHLQVLWVDDAIF